MGTARVSALGSVSFGWLHQQGGFVFDEPFFLDPYVRQQRERQVNDFVEERFPSDPVYNIEAHLVQVEGRQQPVLLVGGLQPNLILGVAAGARFVFYGDKDADITPTPLANVHNLQRLMNLDWTGRWPLSMFLDQIGEAREKWGNEYRIVPPFFWDTTGRATIHGIVTTAQKLIGERVFIEMADHTSFVADLFHWIAESYATLIELFADAAGLRITGLHVGDCSLCMVGPKPFTELVLPHLNALARRIGPLRLHSCGHSDHLLEVFRQVERLATLNVGSGTSLAKIRTHFGPLRVDLLPDSHLLMSGSPAEVDTFVRQCVEANGDGELQLEYHLDLGQPEENCLQIHRTLESLGYPASRCKIH
jgi:hypothetical protein